MARIKRNKKKEEPKAPFKERHPKLYIIFGGLILLFFVLVGILIAITVVITLFFGLRLLWTKATMFFSNWFSTTDKVIVVAMITGTLSIIGVVISSIVSKVVEYRFNVKKFLYDKREAPYEQFIEMIYKIMENEKKPPEEQLSENDISKLVSEFSQGLTLWGSNKVAKKWISYRKKAFSEPGSSKYIFLLEDIIFEMRKDVGIKRGLRKGDILSFFINDIDIIKKEKIRNNKND